jgi:deazaflavin-dependent oxidoreductase (nitroreductase family)
MRAYNRFDLAVGNAVMRVLGPLHAWAYEKSGGRLGKTLLGAPVGNLVNTGAKSGKVRHTPLLMLSDGDNIVIVASKGGWPEHPGWYFNLKANPDCEAVINGETRSMTARVADDAEREVLWPKLDEMYRYYRVYRRRAALVGREIPIFVLEPHAT